MTSRLRVTDHHVLTSLNHKWLTYLVNLCNDIHNNVAHNDNILMFTRQKCDFKVILMSYDNITFVFM